jgi:hypothetical protein
VEAQGAEDGIGLQGISTNDACTASDCFISVDTTATAPIGIVDRGSLFVTADPLSPQSHILLVGSTTADPLLRLRLRAEGEDIDVHFLRITGIPSSVESLLLYRVPIGTNADLSNLTPIAQATSGQCRVQTGDTACVEFATSTLTVKNQEEIGLVVGAKIKGKSSGGLSGQSFTLSLVDSISDATHAIEARGVRSTGELAQNDGDAKAEGEIFIGTGTPGSGGPIIGKIQDTAFAAIDRITRSGPEYQPYITTGLSPIGSFTFHALPHANGPTEATLESLTFTVTAQNVTVDPVSMRLRPTNDPESWKSCRAAGTTGTITVTCDGLNADFFGTIPQGQDRTYELLVNIVNPEASPGASAIGAQLTPLGTPSQNNAVHWADGTTSFTWVNTGNTQVNGTVYQSK